jgi:hypothetical protein
LRIWKKQKQKHASVVKCVHFLFYYPLNNTKNQLLTQNLHCISYYK